MTVRDGFRWFRAKDTWAPDRVPAYASTSRPEWKAIER